MALWPLCGFSAETAARTPPTVRISPYARYLNGHIFLRNNLLSYPFVTPYMNSTLEVAMAKIQIAGAKQDIKSIGLSPSINGQFRIWNFGIEFGGQFSEIFGANSYSAYVLGAAIDYGYSARAKYALYRDDLVVITPSLFYGFDKGRSFSPLDVVARAVESPEDASTKNIIQKTTTRQLRPSLLTALAVSPLLGFTGELGMTFQSYTDSTPVDSKSIRLGISAETNLSPDTGIPLGTALFFRNDIPWKAKDQSATPILGLGIYEMVGRSFNFGLEFSRLMRSSSSLSVLLGITGYY